MNIFNQLNVWLRRKFAETFTTNDDGETAIRTLVSNDAGEITVQNPLPTDGDSIYAKDIDIAYSDNYNFSGEVTDYFDSLKTVNTDTTSNNPKQIKVWLKRTVYASEIGFGCDNLAESFSNIKIELLGSGEVVRRTIDYSSDNTKYNSLVIPFEPSALNGFIISFATTDTVCLSNITMRKEIKTKAQIVALNDSNEIVDIKATNNGNFKVAIQEYGDTPAVDAFARLRVSETFTIFDSKQLHDKQPLFWDESIGGSATSVHNPVNAETRMSVTASASDFVIRQTKQRFNYQPGKSQLAFMTFHSPQTAGATKRIGLFDGTGTNNLTPNNGIFFECDGSISWNIAKNGTIAEIATQANWNVDTLDGSGDENNPSGITLDLDGSQILLMDYEWLGVGRVRVGFVIDGLIYYVHYFNHANDPNFNSVYMSTPNLPLRYTIETDGTEATHMDHICSTVISEGGIEKTGILRSVENANGFVTGYGTANKYALTAIRLKSNYLDVSVIPESVNVVIGTNDAFKWELHLNPSINGTFTYNDLTNSSVQFAQGTTANTIATDGLIIARGAGSVTSRGDTSDLQTALRIGSTIAGTRDELVLVIQPFGANLSVWSGLNFRELL